MRVDYLFYLLQGALDDIHVEYIKMRDGLAPLPLSKEDKLRKRSAATVPFEHALSVAIPLLDEKKVLHTQGIGEQVSIVRYQLTACIVLTSFRLQCIVKSFKSPAVLYSVSFRPTSGLNMNEPEGLIQSCTCSDYQRRRRPCKHIYLLDRLYAHVRVDHYLHLEHVGERQVEMKESQDQDVPSWIPLPVKQYLYAERARERDKERRRFEQQRATAIADCEKEVLALWQHLGVSSRQAKSMQLRVLPRVCCSFEECGP